MFRKKIHTQNTIFDIYIKENIYLEIPQFVDLVFSKIEASIVNQEPIFIENEELLKSLNIDVLDENTFNDLYHFGLAIASAYIFKNNLRTNIFEKFKLDNDLNCTFNFNDTFFELYGNNSK